VSATPFDRIHHLVTVPVLVDGRRVSRFVLDTGIGLTLLSESLCAAIACETNGSTFTGRRMSGQEVTVPLADAPSLSFGGLTRRDHVVGVIELGGFPPQVGAVDGFLSLAFFENAAFTVDYARGAVVVESPALVDGRARGGSVVAVRLERDGPAVDAFMQLDIPGGRTIEVEVDMGSDSLILDERLADGVGVDLDHDDDVRRVDDRDETGYPYTRSFTRLRGAIHPAGAPSVAQSDPDVMFQRIIYEGLVGDAFLRRFTVTYDVPRERVIFGPGAPRV
jgi:Aspartyl protease